MRELYMLGYTDLLVCDWWCFLLIRSTRNLMHCSSNGCLLYFMTVKNHCAMMQCTSRQGKLCNVHPTRGSDAPGEVMQCTSCQGKWCSVHSTRGSDAVYIPPGEMMQCTSHQGKWYSVHPARGNDAVYIPGYVCVVELWLWSVCVWCNDGGYVCV